MSESSSDPAPRYACHCTFTVSATLRRSIGRGAHSASRLAQASPRRSVRRTRVPRGAPAPSHLPHRWSRPRSRWPDRRPAAGRRRRWRGSWPGPRWRWPPGPGVRPGFFGRGRLAHRRVELPIDNPPFDGLSKVVPRLKGGAAEVKPRPALFTRLSRGAPRAAEYVRLVATRSDVEPPRRTGRPRRNTRAIVEDDPRSGILAAAGRLFAERGVSGTHDGRDRPRLGSPPVVALLLLPQQGARARGDRRGGQPGAVGARRAGPTRGRSGRGPALPDHPRRRGGLVRIALRPERDPSPRRPRPRDLPSLLGGAGLLSTR